MTGERIYLFDTTLRDGAQTQGVDFSVADKRLIAEELDRLGLDYIEGGWPGANPTDDPFFAHPPKPKRARSTAVALPRRRGRTADTAPARRVGGAGALRGERGPELEVEGEMQADVALNEELRARIFPDSRLRGQPNLFIFPSLDAANSAFHLVKALGDGLPVGPILLGAAAPAHITTPSVTARGLLNLSALAVVDAQRHAAEGRGDGAAPGR